MKHKNCFVFFTIFMSSVFSSAVHADEKARDALPKTAIVDGASNDEHITPPPSVHVTTRPLNLSRHRMNIGGNLSLPMSYDRHGEFKFGIRFMPSFGVFLRDNLELKSSVGITVDYAFSNVPNAVTVPVLWDISSTVIYYFSTPSRVRPYLGAGLGFGMMDVSIFSINVLVDLPIGLLVELGENIALDVGIPVRLRMSARSLADFINFPLGVIGLRYFF